MKTAYIVAFALLVTSCIPIRIAPIIEDYNIVVGKKFRRTLPKEYAFVFKDSKDANEFYNFIDKKFILGNVNVESNVPIEVKGVQYYLSFYEAEIPDKTLNLLPIAIDVATSNSNFQTDLSETYTSRIGNWYIAVTVTDEEYNNALNPLYPFRNDIIKYLKSLKEAYLMIP